MKPHYTAKMYLDNNDVIENSSDDLEQLSVWMDEQVESAFSTIKGEILDNKRHEVIKRFEFSPPEE